MNIHQRNPRLRRSFAFVALVTIAGLSALGLTQCRMVDNTVTGVDARSNIAFAPGPHPTCIQRCNEAFKTCQKAEQQRHIAAMRACNQLPVAQRQDCRRAESRQHVTQQRACVTRMQSCKRECPGNTLR